MKIKNKIIEFVKKETVLTAAMVLAVLSAVMIPPDKEYIGYIDFRTLAILFCLMTVMAGLQKLGIFRRVASQVISNVPAALLLSGFTENVKALIVGTNLGGLGTLIASMASLISYKQVASQIPGEKKRYFGWFTVVNVGFLLLLLFINGLL